MNQIVSGCIKIYNKYPYLLILLISMLLTLPWLSMGAFYTKGEPREATVAMDILNTGNWILPVGYADEIAYKPPFMHWFIAAFSLVSGHVTEATSRMPSALGLIGITMLFFGFLYVRKDKTLALLSALLMLTSFEMHRSGIEARVDMFLGFFMVASLIGFYKWEEKQLRGFPWLISLALAGAALVKGPVGILLPAFVFAVYLLLLQEYSLGKIIVKCILVSVPALLIASVWYVLAYGQGGTHFLKLVFAENFGRFLGMDKAALGISYDLGHKGPFWYYIPALFLGFLPWSLLIIPALVVAGYKNAWIKLRAVRLRSLGQRIKVMDKVTLFSIVVLLVIVGFYAIPSSKRSVYIIPVYPFAAFLLAQLYRWASEKRPSFLKIVHGFIAALGVLFLLLTCVFHFVDLTLFAEKLIKSEHTLHDVKLFADAFMHPSVFSVLLWFVLALVAGFSFFIVYDKKKQATVWLFVTLGLMVSLQLFLEGAIFPVFKNGYSVRSFAASIQARYDLKKDTYVMNDLDKYRNLYGMNFYMGNHFLNFEKVQPESGYFICGKSYVEEIKSIYSSKYTFEELTESPDRFNAYNDVIVLFKIQKIGDH